MNVSKGRILAVTLLCFVSAITLQAQHIGDGPVLRDHVSQADIEANRLTFQEIFDLGDFIFSAKWNMFDGQSRPGTTGGGAAREVGSAPTFIRTSAPDANSCAGCHNDPIVGAAGDIVANVFVLAQTLDPVTESVNGAFSNERNTLGMHGAGPIEMLAREMTAELQGLRDEALAEAADSGSNVTKQLIAKGVHFGSLVATPDGQVDGANIEGIDSDLVLKPFHQKGAVISLREFSNNAYNHHHGMQSTERFGTQRTGTNDFDQDGVVDEMTVGDITAVTIWQAALGTPGQVIPNDATLARAIIKGERTFTSVGCGDCHVPSLQLNDTVFTEPNPYNPAGNLRPSDVEGLVAYSFDMAESGDKPRLERRYDGGAEVRAFTDLKRHNLCDEDYNHFCNEQVVQGGIPTEDFLTRKLWDVGNTAPYGHRGDLTTITEAIYYHGGEARGQRDAFFNLPDHRQAEVIEFLKSLQILPEDASGLIVDENGKRVNKKALQRKFSGETTVRKPEGTVTSRR